MKVLHTSDWHLGRTLYGHKRTREFESFLNWLLSLIERDGIEVLLISGDIFDTTTPSNRVQSLYYNFLSRVTAGCCEHVIIVGGNHDSPTFLEAPREILKSQQVHVVGCCRENIDDEVITITDANNTIQLLVCAVPYIRERDIRIATPGESIEEKGEQLVLGIHEHYRRVIESALAIRSQTGRQIPLIVMGHLFTTGATVSQGDGMRDLYVGSLAHVPVSIFPPVIDYVALGHLHKAQRIGGSDTRRFCGSPLSMSFGEAQSSKGVIEVTFEETVQTVETVPVPTFQKLRRISGDATILKHQLQELKTTGESIWLEIIYRGRELVDTLQEELQAMTRNSSLEILRIVNENMLAKVILESEYQEKLEDLTVEEVFYRCLQQKDITPADQLELTQRFQLIVKDLEERDSNAE